MNLYEQYNRLQSRLNETAVDDITTNLLRPEITEKYFDRVNEAACLLENFYETYLTSGAVRRAVNQKLASERGQNVKFCLLVDIFRCYDGLDHPTSFNTPEGVAFMVLLARLLHVEGAETCTSLAKVRPVTLSLIDLVPYIEALSYEMGKTYTLCLSSILLQTNPSVDPIYRKLLYKLCKAIAQVDGKITIAEEEWLNEIALLNDDDPDNDIDISNL